MSETLKGNKEGSPTSPPPQETEKDFDGVVFTFVDEEILETPRSLAVVGDEEFEGPMITEMMANVAKLLKSGARFEEHEYFKNAKYKRLLELIWKARLKIIVLIDSCGGLFSEGLKVNSAMSSRNDNEVFVPFVAQSMASKIFEQAQVKHVGHKATLTWHMSTASITASGKQNPNSNILYLETIYNKIFFLTNTPNECKAIVFDRIGRAEKDPNNPRNQFGFRGDELFCLGLAQRLHFSASEMKNSIIKTTGIEHPKVTEFFDIAEETSNAYLALPYAVRAQTSYHSFKDEIIKQRSKRIARQNLRLIKSE